MALHRTLSSLRCVVKTAPTAETKEAFQDVDLVASKSYSATGVVTIGIWHEDSYYVVLEEGSEEQPLLDSRYAFDAISERGHLSTEGCRNTAPGAIFFCFLLLG